MRRTRISKCAQRILSCTGRKITRYTTILVCTILMSACASNVSTEKADSWEVYCEKYGVNPSEPTEAQENFYLDCYAGSVEEENDMRGYAVLPFSTENVSEVVSGVVVHSYFYVVYTDPNLNMEHECLRIDAETADMIKSAITSRNR